MALRLLSGLRVMGPHRVAVSGPYNEQLVPSISGLGYFPIGERKLLSMAAGVPRVVTNPSR